jgi:hypothetical protein
MSLRSKKQKNKKLAKKKMAKDTSFENVKSFISI